MVQTVPAADVERVLEQFCLENVSVSHFGCPGGHVLALDAVTRASDRCLPFVYLLSIVFILFSSQRLVAGCRDARVSLDCLPCVF